MRIEIKLKYRENFEKKCFIVVEVVRSGLCVQKLSLSYKVVRKCCQSDVGPVAMDKKPIWLLEIGSVETVSTQAESIAAQNRNRQKKER